MSGSATLIVTALASIAVAPANSTLELGFNQAFVATGTLTDNSTQDVTQTATWSSSDSAVLLLNNSDGRVGVANPRGPGMATVTAAVGSIKGTTQVTVVRPTPKFLYAAGGGEITAFRVDPATGSLTAVGTPTPAGGGSVSLAVTRDSIFLYSAEGGTNPGFFSGFAIQPDGSLLGVPGNPFPLAGATGITAHPTADFLYACGDETTVVAYDPASGVPTTQNSIQADCLMPFGAPVQAIAPDGSHLYQLSKLGEFGVAGFSVDSATGALSELPTGAGGGGACVNPEGFYSLTALAMDPAGKFAYVAVAGFAGNGDCVSTWFRAYSIAPSSGALTLIPGAPFGAGENPTSVAVEASGRFLFVANNSSQSVSVYSINSDTGVPTQVTGSPFATASAPTFIVADPSALYLYVGTASGIVGFTIDQTTGALTANPGATADVSVGFIAVTH